MQTIEADYLVIGAGAMGMAFVDTWSAETDATVVIVDRNDQPGGHWTQRLSRSSGCTSRRPTTA